MKSPIFYCTCFPCASLCDAQRKTCLIPAGQRYCCILPQRTPRLIFYCARRERSAVAQASIGTFPSRDYRVHDNPMETIQEAARSLQHTQRVNSARPPITQSANFYPGSRCRSAGGVPKPPSRALAQALHQRQGGHPTARRPRRQNHGKSAHESGAPSAHPRQPVEQYIPRSTINTRPVRGSSAKACLPSVPGGLRMLQQSVHASTAARGCTSSRCGQRARQQQQQQQQQEVLIPKAAQPQDMPPIPCAAGPAQLHEQVATAPSDEPLPQDAEEASLPGAAKRAEQQEEASCPSSPQPAQLHAVPTAGSISVEGEPQSSAGGATQPEEHVNKSSKDPEVGSLLPQPRQQCTATLYLSS